MNYVAELNAFHDWCEKHYLRNESQFLWFKLMAKNNRLGWCEWMSVDNLELMSILRVKREATAIEIRDKLIEAGLVKYVKGKKGVSNQYKMVSLSKLKVESVVNSVVESAVNSVAESAVNSVVKSADINKQNETKQNETKKKEKEKKEKPLSISFSEILQDETESFKTVVMEFVEHRKRLKKPFLTEVQFTKWLKTIRELGDEQTQISCMEKSIAEGWQGVFLPKTNGGDNLGSNPRNNSRRADANQKQSDSHDSTPEYGVEI